MKVFVVLKGHEADFHNDWDTLSYYDGMNCVGVFTTLPLAKASTGILQDWIETRINSGCLELGEGWKHVAKDRSRECHFIIKRKLIVE